MKLSPALVIFIATRSCGGDPSGDAATTEAAPAPVGATRDPGLEPRLYVVRRETTGLRSLTDGETARAGDLVQVGYVAAGHTHGVIVSIDGNGHVTLHHPAAPDADARLHPRGRHPLAHAFELDAAAGFERFVLVASGDEPLDPRVVMQAAAQLVHEGSAAASAPLPLPSTWHQTSLLLRKP